MAATGLATRPHLSPLDAGHAVNLTLAQIAAELDLTDPRQMAQLRAAADAAHTLHATQSASPLRRRATGLLEDLHGRLLGSTTPCPLRGA